VADSIAHYRIGTKLGQGGMGEVYRATDTKLGREVAVKLIAPSLAQDEVRMASFAREARTLASLNHPNIAAIYGVEDQALVMELVEGQTLAERIKSGPIPLEEALGIARQIADGLSSAHEKGIVHRDLKPANIKITPDGTVKLLDFGLAKAAAAAAVVPDETATVALSMAASGMIVGTPGYMAPEQARGQPVDKRADIWSFGVVLYEMLTGAALFNGQTMTDIMAAVVREEPDLTRVPPAVRPVLRRCLEKDPKRRLRDIADAMLLLDGASDPGAAIDAPRGGVRTWLPWAVAAALLVALAVVLVTQLRETPAEAPLVRFKFSLPDGVTFTQTAPFAISPDGRRLAFPAVGDDGVARVWVHDFSEAEPRPLAEVQPNRQTMVWSPDSRQVLYIHQDQAKRVDIGGSPPEVVVQLPGPGVPDMLGAVWLADGTIVFGTNAGIVKVPATGGTPEPVTTPAAGEVHLVLGRLVDGKFLYSNSGAPGARTVYVGSPDLAPDRQDPTPVLKTDLGARFAPSSPSAHDGHLLFMREATLVAQTFDARTRQLSGEPVALAAGVLTTGGPVLGLPYLSVSSQGTIVYRTGTVSDLARQLVWFGRDGQSLGNVGERGRYQQMKISPDGSRLAASQTEIKTGNNADVWVTDLSTQTRTRLTFGPGADAQPTWSPDGQSIAWVEVRDRVASIYRKLANGAGNDELLYRFPQGSSGGIILSDWSSNGFLVIAHAGDIFALPVGPDSDATRQPIPIVQTPAREFGPDLSPDGRWLVYISDESGRQELFVKPFAPQANADRAAQVTGKWMVSDDGTLGLARWRGDSKELFFTDAEGALMAVDVDASDARAFQAGPPRRLFQLPRPFVAQTPSPGTLADIRHDGQRVLLAMPSEESTRPELSVILNWKPAQP
jgi:Tol biopolymer transport system component/predicted Ser/Thr protein kinase